ncbi:MAG: tetratricopeptide repeat protein [Nitrospirae bacterium]|nr:tetratricopeptide repeat protein [Nitrospirota bacterium]
MPSGKYKKLTIAVITALIIGIVILAVTTSDHKEGGVPSSGAQRNSVPSGPVMDSNARSPIDQLEDLPDDPEELTALGDKYFETGRYDKAARAYEKAIQKRPNDVDAYNDLGLSLHFMKRSDDAADILRKGTQVDPSYQRVRLSLGYVLMSSGQKEEAKVILKKVVEMNPDTDIGIEAKRLLTFLK